MGLRTSLDFNTEVVLATAVTQFALPALVTDGAAINVVERDDVKKSTVGAWRLSGEGGGRADAALFFTSSQAATLSAGLGIYGWRTDLAQWFLLGQLNGGTAIPLLAATAGWSAIVETVGVLDRLAIGPLTAVTVTVSAGTCTVRACQLRQVEDIWA